MINDSNRENHKHWIGCDVEAEYFGEDRKHGKVDRKKASAKDRSQYKKTDKDQLLKTNENDNRNEVLDHLLRGRVLSITPAGIIIDHEGEVITCSLRGFLKQHKSQFKNLITVGDWVLFERSSNKEGSIHTVEARRSFLSRADNLSRRKEQLIAANIDQVIITVSVVQPPLKPFLVDRYIIATREGGMEPVIVVNKIDLLNEDAEDPHVLEETALFKEFIQAYSNLQVPVILVSARTGQGMDELREIMRNKSSVFSGQSGVGKSSLINAVSGQDLPIGHIVEKTKKGTHTTTTANLLPLSFGGWVIDTPGIKSFGLWDLTIEEIRSYFNEFFDCGLNCKFPSCTHMHESDCAVLEAIDKGEISALRYQSYLYLIESSSREHKRR